MGKKNVVLTCDKWILQGLILFLERICPTIPTIICRIQISSQYFVIITYINKQSKLGIAIIQEKKVALFTRSRSGKKNILFVLVKT